MGKDPVFLYWNEWLSCCVLQQLFLHCSPVMISKISFKWWYFPFLWSCDKVYSRINRFVWNPIGLHHEHFCFGLEFMTSGSSDMRLSTKKCTLVLWYWKPIFLHVAVRKWQWTAVISMQMLVGYNGVSCSAPGAPSVQFQHVVIFFNRCVYLIWLDVACHVNKT